MSIISRLRAMLGVWGALAALASLPVAAQVNESVAERLMRDSGLWEQVADLGPNLKQAFLQVAENPPAGADAQGQTALRRLAAVTEEAFSPVALRLVVRRELAARLAPQHLPALDAWHTGPLGRRITALEVVKSAERDGGEARQKEAAQKWAAATPQRRALLQDFQVASRSAEAAASSMLNLMIAMQIGVVGAVGGPEMPPLQVMRQQLEPQRQKMQAEMGPVALSLSADMYASLSDADLQAYLAFQKSEAGQHMTGIVMQVLDVAVAESAEEMGRMITRR